MPRGPGPWPPPGLLPPACLPPLPPCCTQGLLVRALCPAAAALAPYCSPRPTAAPTPLQLSRPTIAPTRPPAPPNACS
jgi:hypothetical protein